MLSLLMSFLLMQAPAAAPAPVQAPGDRYTFRGVPGFEREHVYRIFDALGVRAGAVIADWGAGEGRFTRAIATNVGETGRVLAIEIDESAIVIMRDLIEHEDITGPVELILSPPEGPDLDDHSLDGVLMVITYHEIEPLDAVMANVRAALKPGGRLVVVDLFRPSMAGQPREQQVRRHGLEQEIAEQEIRDFGFRILEVVPEMFREQWDESLPMWMIVAEPVPVATE